MKHIVCELSRWWDALGRSFFQGVTMERHRTIGVDESVMREMGGREEGGRWRTE